MSREETTRACLTLRSRQLEALKRLSQESGAPVAELARRAVDAFLAGRVAGFVPLAGSGVTEAGEAGPSESTPNT
jgi:hypothetical protein